MAGNAITFVVNDYDNSGNGDANTLDAPLSYFVLGSARGVDDDPAPGLRGDELVSGIKFKDDLRDTVNPNKTYYRNDGSVDEIQVGTESMRSTLTSELLTRGGIREHTDGNRISTTRGDCVEVVYGNYKLVVLGRITDDFDPTGQGGLGDAGNGADGAENPTLHHTVVDMSGGHITEATSAEGKVVSCVWQNSDDGGSWDTLEQTDLGDKKSVFHGAYKRVHFGPSIVRAIGVGAEAITIDNGSNTAAGHAVDKPDITDEVYARSIVHTETVGSRTETVNVSKKHETRFEVSDRYTDARCFGTESQVTMALGFREELMADTIKTEHDNTAWRLELEAGLASAKIYTIPYHEVAKTGSHYRAWFFGMDVQFLAGLSTSLNVGMDSIYRTGPSIDQNTGPTIRLATTCDAVLGLHKGAMWLYRHSLGILVGKIAAARNKNSTVSITV